MDGEKIKMVYLKEFYFIISSTAPNKGIKSIKFKIKSEKNV